MIHLGIDPGKSGGLALLADGGCVLGVTAMPETVHELAWWIEKHVKGATAGVVTVRAVIEQVGAMPGQGRQSMFVFGRNCGQLEGVLAALRVPYYFVRPAVWQKDLGLPKRKEKAEHKRVLKRKAQELFPRQDVTLKTADALLLAEWGRRRETTSTQGKSYDNAQTRTNAVSPRDAYAEEGAGIPRQSGG